MARPERAAAAGDTDGVPGLVEPEARVEQVVGTLDLHELRRLDDGALPGLVGAEDLRRLAEQMQTIDTQGLAVDAGVGGLGHGVFVGLPEDVCRPLGTHEGTWIDGPAERRLADEGRGLRDVGTDDPGADGVADAHRGRRGAPQQRGEVEHVVVAEWLDVGRPRPPRLGPGRQDRQGIGHRPPLPGNDGRPHGDIGAEPLTRREIEPLTRREIEPFTRREEVVVSILDDHEGIGLVGPRADPRPRRRGVRGDGWLVVRSRWSSSGRRGRGSAAAVVFAAAVVVAFASATTTAPASINSRTASAP